MFKKSLQLGATKMYKIDVHALIGILKKLDWTLDWPGLWTELWTALWTLDKF